MLDHVLEQGIRAEESDEDSDVDGGGFNTKMTRRGALGVLAAGAVVAACGDPSEISVEQLASPSSSAATPSTAAATGTETIASTTAASETTVIQVVAAEPVFDTSPKVGQVVLPTSDMSDNTLMVTENSLDPSTDTTVATEPTPATDPTSNQSATDPTTSDPSTAETPASTAPPATNPPSQSFPPLNTTSSAEAVVAKLTFGATPGMLAGISSPGAYIADQLGRSQPDAAVENRLNGYKYLKRTALQISNADKANPNGVRDELTHANFVRARYSSNQLFEMMSHLWMDHFNISLDSNRSLIPEYQENVIRANAMGSFRDLLRATANSPAMLHYLDNDVSNASDALKVNENYGRELLELHSLGIDPQGNQIYTQEDVEQAARVMAGWSTHLNRRRDGNKYGTFVYRQNYAHDGELSLLNGAWTTAGKSGKARGDSLLDFLAGHPTTARHIAYKICRRFVSDSPPESLVSSAAAVYQQNDTAIVPVLQHVFGSAEFAASGGSKVRRPFEFLAAALRATNATVPYGHSSNGAKSIRNFLSSTRNKSWYWEQPDGYPDRADHWIVADSFLARWNMAGAIPRGNAKGIQVKIADVQRSAGGNTVGELTTNLGLQFGLGRLSDAVIQTTAAAAGHTAGDPASDLNGQQMEIITGLLLANPLFQIR